MARKMLSDQEIITALMAQPTITKAAEMLGVSRQTIYNRLASADFQEKLRQAQQARDEYLGHLQETATVEAVECLVGILQEQDDFWSSVTPDHRIAAARTLLEYTKAKK